MTKSKNLEVILLSMEKLEKLYKMKCLFMENKKDLMVISSFYSRAKRVS